MNHKTKARVDKNKLIAFGFGQEPKTEEERLKRFECSIALLTSRSPGELFEIVHPPKSDPRTSDALAKAV